MLKQCTAKGIKQAKHASDAAVFTEEWSIQAKLCTIGQGMVTKLLDVGPGGHKSSRQHRETETTRRQRQEICSISLQWERVRGGSRRAVADPACAAATDEASLAPSVRSVPVTMSSPRLTSQFCLHTLYSYGTNRGVDHAPCAPSASLVQRLNASQLCVSL